MCNRILKSISVLFILACISFVSISPCFAAENELKINSEVTVKKGDTIKYELYLSDTKEEIWGYEMRIFYNKEYLKLTKDALKFPKFDGVVYNDKLENKIAITWTDISSPADFSKRDLFLSVQFEVLRGGTTDISQFVTELYGEDLKYLKSYKWSYDISVNGAEVISEKTPIIDADEATLQNKQGSFINYIDGMGEENSPNKDDHQSVTGVMPTTKVVTEIQDVTRYESTGSGDSSDDNVFGWIIIIAIIAVVVGAAVAVVFIIRKP